MRSNKNKKNNPRKWRGYTALIKYQHSSLPIVALLCQVCTHSKKELQKRAFNGEIGIPFSSKLISRFTDNESKRKKVGS
jgi:hypothetical protein